MLALLKKTLFAVTAFGLSMALASTTHAAGTLYGSNLSNTYYRIDAGIGNNSPYVTVPDGIGQGLTMDPSNNLYVIANDGSNYNIVKVTPALVQSTFYAATGTSGRTLAADASNIYGAGEGGDGAAWQYPLSGGETNLGPAGSGSISIASTPAGVLYVSGYGGDGTPLRIERYTGAWSTYYDPGATVDPTDYPSFSHQSAVDDNGNYILADGPFGGNNGLYRYNGGSQTRDLLLPGNFSGVVVDHSDGTIYASNWDTGDIYTLDNDGTNPQLFASGFNAWRLAITTEAEANGVPEPSTFALSALGLAGLGLCAWRRRRALLIDA